MMEENNKIDIILASQSKIRKKQLEDANIHFEVIVSDADETSDETKTFKNQLAEIAMRKAMTVFEETKNRGKRIIIAGDQNIVFNDKMYGKPKDIEEAKENIIAMNGREDIYAYTGNAVLLADKDKILQSINITDTARLKMDNITDQEIDEYVNNSKCLTYCGGISVTDSTFLHLIEGRDSTTKGLTLEYAIEMIENNIK